MKRHSLTMALLIGLAGLGSAHALEEVLFVGDADAPQPYSNPQHVNQQKNALRIQLALRMDDLDRICKLTEQQKKKLEVAIKGVVQKQFHHAENAEGHEHGEHDHAHDRVQVIEGLDIVVQQAAPQPLIVRRAIGLIAPQALEDEAGAEAVEAVVDEEEEAPEEPLVEIEPPVVQPDRVIINVGPPEALQEWIAAPHQPFAIAAPVESDPLWQQTVDRVLTAEQKKAYAVEQNRRANVRSQATIAMGIAEATERLMLSEGQQQQLSRLCQAAVKRDPNAIHSLSNVQSMVQVVDYNHAKEFLSKAQRVSWEQARRTPQPPVWGMPQLNQVDVPVFQVR